MNVLKLRCLIVLQFAFWSSGCGDGRPNLVRVAGHVAMNGQPVTAGAIIFHPDAANGFQNDKPSSVLQLDGSFSIKTYPFGDGVPPGRYKVTLAPELATRIGRPGFGNVSETPWEINVPPAGITDHVFELP